MDSYILFFFTIISDVEPPSISCPDDIIQSSDKGTYFTHVYWPQPVVADNVGIHNMTYSHLNGSTFNLGHTNVTLTAFDAEGYSASCVFLVLIEGKIINCTYCMREYHKYVHVATF